MKHEHEHDPAPAEAARDEALERVARAGALWSETARPVIRTWCDHNHGVEITSEDLWTILANAGIPKPLEPRVMGALLRGLAREGLIRVTTGFMLGTRVERHRAPVRIWKVL